MASGEKYLKTSEYSGVTATPNNIATWVLNNSTAPVRRLNDDSINGFQNRRISTLGTSILTNDFVVYFSNTSSKSCSLPTSPYNGECHIIMNPGGTLTLSFSGKTLYLSGSNYTNSCNIDACVIFLFYNGGSWYGFAAESR